ncbi:hypothetical protein ANN_16100 [Periplaneta americana]|uniref:Uncharacterized protein n=1 Tax=Periplaneta americana TaxID=6978 RepID=A0ABQ8SIB5_PERAM|nr:hypothetical protein ANN_16100 [Periplaneta americana]
MGTGRNYPHKTGTLFYLLHLLTVGRNYALPDDGDDDYDDDDDDDPYDPYPFEVEMAGTHTENERKQNSQENTTTEEGKEDLRRDGWMGSSGT